MSKPNQLPRFNILIDTCVWLDVAKDYQQQAILAALKDLIRQKDIALILPRTIVDEFSPSRVVHSLVCVRDGFKRIYQVAAGADKSVHYARPRLVENHFTLCEQGKSVYSCCCF